MSGLLLKDWYVMKKNCRIYVWMVLIFLIISLMGDSNTFFAFYPCFICSVLPVNLLSFDENSRWHQYSAALPYTREQIVSAKYLIGLLSLAALMLLTAGAQSVRVAAGVFSGERLAALLMMMLTMSLFATAICLPFVFRFGVERGRAAYFVTVGFVCAASVLASNVLDDSKMAEVRAGFPLIAVSLASVGLYALSWYLSIKFYKKREL